MNALASPDGLNHDRPSINDSHLGSDTSSLTGAQGSINGADPTLRDPNAALKSYDHRMTAETTLGVLFVVAVVTTAVVLWIALDKDFRRLLLRIVTFGKKGKRKEVEPMQVRSTWYGNGGSRGASQIPARPGPPVRTASGDSGTTMGSRVSLQPVLSTVSEELTRCDSRPPVLPPIRQANTPVMPPTLQDNRSVSSDGTICVSPEPTNKNAGDGGAVPSSGP